VEYFKEIVENENSILASFCQEFIPQQLLEEKNLIHIRKSQNP
jgi:hypothetical protein